MEKIVCDHIGYTCSGMQAYTLASFQVSHFLLQMQCSSEHLDRGRELALMLKNNQHCLYIFACIIGTNNHLFFRIHKSKFGLVK